LPAQSWPSSAFGQCLDPACYHTRAGIDTFITNLLAYDTSSSGHHIVHVDTIGYSRGQLLPTAYPIYCIKVSSSPDSFVDKPTALIIGHIHGEEVIGLETTLTYIRAIVGARYGLYRTLINNIQMYFFPR